VKRELPSLFCHKCRCWVETQERHEMFAAVEDAPRRVRVWTCADCRAKGAG